MYKAGLVAKLCEMPIRTLQYWAETGILTPSIQETKGTGEPRLYDFRDLVEARIIKKLRNAGISMQKIRKVADYLKEVEDLDAPFAEAYLVSDGDDVFLVKSKDKVYSILEQPGQGVFSWILDVSREVKEIEEEVKKLTA